MKGNERTKEILIFLFSGRWLPEVKTCFLGGIRLVGGFGESRDLWMSPSRSDLVVQSCFFFPCSKSRDLGPEHGFRACAFKNKGKSWIFIFLGSKKRKRIEKLERNRSNVGLRSSRWYQKDAEGQRGYFRKIWAWKTLKKQGKIKIFSGFFPVFPVDFA